MSKKRRLSELSETEKKELLNTLFPTPLEEFSIIDIIDVKEELDKFLKSIDASQEMIDHYQESGLTNKEISKEIKDSINLSELSYEQRLMLAKIESC